MAEDKNISEKHAPARVSGASGDIVSGDFDNLDRDYLYILGDAFLQCGHFDKAETIFNFIENIFEKDTHARKCKAYTYLMQERYEEALDVIAELKQDKIDEISYATLSLIAARTYHKLGKQAEAQAAMEDFIELRKVQMTEGVKKETKYL